MAAVLFVSNGNGEIAIADRIAEELRALRADVAIDHLALVGDSRPQYMNDVGPRRMMPSGGLIAMGNVRNIARDLAHGLLGLTYAQRRFLASVRGRYDRAIAVGDVFGLLMTLGARARTTYVGTAKSVRVAPYGPMERRVLRRADDVFVRDEATAERLRADGVHASAPGNVIVDLFASADDVRANAAVAGFAPAIAIFPGSRASAYADGAFLLDVMQRIADLHPGVGAAFSIAPLLDAREFVRLASEAGYAVEERDDPVIPFVLRIGERVVVRAWRAPIGPLLSRVALVVGQAGTANEAAASAGVPVVAFERGHDRRTAWYRMRQHGLLGDALAIFPGEPDVAARDVIGLLLDDARCAEMARVGRERMGAPGGARAIAQTIASGLP